MRDSRRRMAILGAAAWAVWVCLFASGSAGCNPLPAWLGRLSGTGASWGFFAPRVASAWRCRALGLHGEIELFEPASKEVRLRCGTVLAGLVGAGEKARRAMAAFLAAHAIERGEAQITIVVEYFDSESGVWVEAYRAGFASK